MKKYPLPQKQQAFNIKFSTRTTRVIEFMVNTIGLAISFFVLWKLYLLGYSIPTLILLFIPAFLLTLFITKITLILLSFFVLGIGFFVLLTQKK